MPFWWPRLWVLVFILISEFRWSVSFIFYLVGNEDCLQFGLSRHAYNKDCVHTKTTNFPARTVVG